MTRVRIMVRLTGYVEIAGRREFLNWTITNGRIIEGVGVSAQGIEVSVSTVPVVEPTSSPEVAVEAPVVENKEYADMNKTELQVLCSQRGLDATGLKADLIARLSEDDAGQAEPVTEGETDGGESDSE